MLSIVELQVLVSAGEEAVVRHGPRGGSREFFKGPTLTAWVPVVGVIARVCQNVQATIGSDRKLDSIGVWALLIDREKFIHEAGERRVLRTSWLRRAICVINFLCRTARARRFRLWLRGR